MRDRADAPQRTEEIVRLEATEKAHAMTARALAKQVRQRPSLGYADLAQKQLLVGESDLQLLGLSELTGSGTR